MNSWRVSFKGIHFCYSDIAPKIATDFWFKSINSGFKIYGVKNDMETFLLQFFLKKTKQIGFFFEAFITWVEKTHFRKKLFLSFFSCLPFKEGIILNDFSFFKV